MLMDDPSTDPLLPSSPRSWVTDRRARLRARWDAAAPTLVPVGLGLLAFVGVAFSGARPS